MSYAWSNMASLNPLKAEPVNEPLSGLIVLNPDLLAADILISKGYTNIDIIELGNFQKIIYASYLPFCPSSAL